jgi:pyruvate decarboxylase
MGKTTIDEHHPQFGGVYIGSVTLPPVKAAFEEADFVLSIGALKSDFSELQFATARRGSSLILHDASRHRS